MVQMDFGKDSVLEQNLNIEPFINLTVGGGGTECLFGGPPGRGQQERE